MPAPRKTSRKRARTHYLPAHQSTVLVLQGGGALGAYQAGVYEGMEEAGLSPDWVTGVSIGAINAALIAGNAPPDRLPRLREFWDLVSSGLPLAVPAEMDLLRMVFNRWSASASAAFGVPGFFVPRVPPPMLSPDGSHGALSLYDTSPLRDTLHRLVDFDLINERRTRLAVGAVEVRTGNSKYFDNHDSKVNFGPEHVMASGALPPGLPPVYVMNVPHWDGGLVSNTPLWYVLDDSAHLDALIVQVDLFSARGAMPRNLDQVLERAKDIQYSSKTRANTTRAKQMDDVTAAVRRLLATLPARLRADADAQFLARSTEAHKVSIVQIINRRFDHSSQAKDFEFSRATVRALWDAGRDAVKRTLASPEWPLACATHRGVRTYDLAR